MALRRDPTKGQKKNGLSAFKAVAKVSKALGFTAKAEVKPNYDFLHDKQSKF